MKKQKKTILPSGGKPITMTELGQFTEEVIFPGVERIVQEAVQEAVQGVRKEMVTKEDIKHYATKFDLQEFEERIIGEVRTENLKVLQSNDKMITKLDALLQDQAAHTSLHQQITDDLGIHEKRIVKLEETVKISQ